MATIIGLRKFCVLRFTAGQLNIISASLNDPQVWCRISGDVFDVYEVESVRNNIISLEINVELLYNVLKTFEKAASDGLHIRLQRKLANAIGEENNNQNKKLASLSVVYNELVNSTAINHSFKIPVRLLKKESDERIIEPELSSVDLLLKLPENISSLFRRIDRFKNSKNLSICGDRSGSLSLVLNDDDLKVTLGWNDKLLVQMHQLSDETEDSGETVKVDIRLKDWKLGARCCDICSNVVLIFSQPYAAVLHCYLDDTDDVEIIYYINGITNDNDI